MSKLEVKVDSIRQALLGDKRVVILKAKSSEIQLPIYIDKVQFDLIQRLLLDDEPIPLESILNDLSLPAKLMSKGILETITIGSLEENMFQAKLMLTCDDKPGDTIQVDLPVGNAVALSFITKVPIFIEETLLINTAGSYSYN